MIIYELIECELDEKNFRTDIRSIAFFKSIQNVFDYLTKDGKTHDAISVVGSDNSDPEYIKSRLDSSYSIIKVHTEAFENPLLGWFYPACDTFYYCRSHEVRNYGFFQPEKKKNREL